MSHWTIRKRTLQDSTPCFFCSMVKMRGTYSVEIFVMLRWSWRISYIDLTLISVSLKSCLPSSVDFAYLFLHCDNIIFSYYKIQIWEFSYPVCHSIISRRFVTINLDRFLRISEGNFPCKFKNDNRAIFNWLLD